MMRFMGVWMVGAGITLLAFLAGYRRGVVTAAERAIRYLRREQRAMRAIAVMHRSGAERRAATARRAELQQARQDEISEGTGE
jgi:hypothetical protein